MNRRETQTQAEQLLFGHARRVRAVQRCAAHLRLNRTRPVYCECSACPRCMPILSCSVGMAGAGATRILHSQRPSQGGRPPARQRQARGPCTFAAGRPGRSRRLIRLRPNRPHPPHTATILHDQRPLRGSPGLASEYRVRILPLQREGCRPCIRAAGGRTALTPYRRPTPGRTTCRNWTSFGTQTYKLGAPDVSLHMNRTTAVVAHPPAVPRPTLPGTAGTGTLRPTDPHYHVR
jgi:hypothetical protein